MDWAIELAAATGTVAEVSLEVDGVEDGSPADEDSGNVDVLDAGVTSTDASAETATEAGAFATRWTEGTPAKRSVWAPFMNPIYNPPLNVSLTATAHFQWFSFFRFNHLNMQKHQNE